MPTTEESLLAAVHKYEQEKARLDKRVERNTARRDEAIRKAHAAGLSLRQIAKLAKVSHQRISQLIQRRG
jgi:hypothetical protein